MEPAAASSWETVHAVSTCGFALHNGCTAACGFLAADLVLPVLLTGLAFGYRSGTVTRIACRPRVVGIAISIATVHAILASAARGNSTSIAIATVFLCGGVDSTRSGTFI